MKKRRLFKRKHVFWCIPAALLLAGIIWEAVMVSAERKNLSEPGAYADLGTYRAHYYSQGSGGIAFVFIAGSGTPCAYTDFYELQNMLSETGQTVSFDHAGSGWSSGTKSPRTLENLVNELSALIDTVTGVKPVILICHSLGSLEAIGYAQSRPERVAGIIFLDSGSPEFYSTDSELLAKAVNRGAALFRTTGLNRLCSELNLLLPLYGENIRNPQLPEKLQETDKAMFFKFAGNRASLGTIELMNENAAAVLSGPALGGIPVLVLSSDNGDDWDSVQMQLDAWSENSEQATVNTSEHYIYWANLDEVSNYINDFVSRTAAKYPGF